MVRFWVIGGEVFGCRLGGFGLKVMRFLVVGGVVFGFRLGGFWL